MKASVLRFLIFGFLTISAGSVMAQTAEEYKAIDEGWLVDLEQAYEISKKTGKPIMANFTGSDWCGWCKRLRANVFVHDEFKTWAQKNVVLLELDFPRRTQIPPKYRQQNANLQRAFQVSGFPTVWVFNLEKDATTNQFNIEALGKTGYANTVADFTTGVDQMLARQVKEGE